MPTTLMKGRPERAGLFCAGASSAIVGFGGFLRRRMQCVRRVVRFSFELTRSLCSKRRNRMRIDCIRATAGPLAGIMKRGSMNFNKAAFTGAYGTSAQIPESKRPEVSFVGRSNVGKSSLLNKLLNRKSLAKVSSVPGKTSTVNFFLVDDAIDLVDLPGYGYAKVAKSEKGRWSEMINGYYDQYRYYAMVVSLIDIRHPATVLDEQMIQFLRACELPFMVVLTKADKVSKSQVNQQKAAIRKQLQLPSDIRMIACSSEKGTGIDELRSAIVEACR